jgi:hypothetical protein
MLRLKTADIRRDLSQAFMPCGCHACFHVLISLVFTVSRSCIVCVRSPYPVYVLSRAVDASSDVTTNKEWMRTTSRLGCQRGYTLSNETCSASIKLRAPDLLFRRGSPGAEYFPAQVRLRRWNSKGYQWITTMIHHIDYRCDTGMYGYRCTKGTPESNL